MIVPPPPPPPPPFFGTAFLPSPVWGGASLGGAAVPYFFGVVLLSPLTWCCLLIPPLGGAAFLRLMFWWCCHSPSVSPVGRCCFALPLWVELLPSSLHCGILVFLQPKLQTYVFSRGGRNMFFRQDHLKFNLTSQFEVEIKSNLSVHFCLYSWNLVCRSVVRKRNNNLHTPN